MFPDLWYALHNPSQAAAPMRVSFKTASTLFPSNLSGLLVQELVLLVVPKGDATIDLSGIRLAYTRRGEQPVLFEVGPVTQDDIEHLNQETVSALVFEAFANQGSPLEAASIEVLTKDVEWTIAEVLTFDAGPLNSDDEGQLNDGVIPEFVREAFAGEDLTLTDAARVETVTTGSEWAIVDEGNRFAARLIGPNLIVIKRELHFTVRRDGDSLAVYDSAFFAVASSLDGIVSTRRPSGVSWTRFVGQAPGRRRMGA